MRRLCRRTLRSMLCNIAGSMLCSIAQGGRGDLCMGSPWYWLLTSSSLASLKKSVSGREAYSVVVLSVCLLPSTRRTSAMCMPALAFRSCRIVAGTAMRSNRCICFNCNTSAIVTFGTGACGKDVLCSSACACDLRRSIAMRHGV